MIRLHGNKEHGLNKCTAIYMNFNFVLFYGCALEPVKNVCVGVCVTFRLVSPAAVHLVVSNLFLYIWKRTDFFLSKISIQLQENSGYTVVFCFAACLKYWCFKKASGNTQTQLLLLREIFKPNFYSANISIPMLT